MILAGHGLMRKCFTSVFGLVRGTIKYVEFKEIERYEEKRNCIAAAGVIMASCSMPVYATEDAKLDVPYISLGADLEYSGESFCFRTSRCF